MKLDKYGWPDDNYVIRQRDKEIEALRQRVRELEADYKIAQDQLAELRANYAFYEVMLPAQRRNAMEIPEELKSLMRNT